MASRDPRRVCEGDCELVQNWTVDQDGGGFSQASTSVTVEFSNPFTGTAYVKFRDWTTDELEVADEKEVDGKSVVLFEFSGSYESNSDAYLTVQQAEVTDDA